MASRRQTRLTAISLVGLLQREGEDKHRQWLGMDQLELEQLLETVKDDNLKITLTYGVGMHHAGLQQFERALVEKVDLFQLQIKLTLLVVCRTENTNSYCNPHISLGN